jgi:hypothetical protein
MLIDKQHQEESEFKEVTATSGRRIDNSEEQLSPLLATGWQALDFESSVEMLATIDPNVREQKVVLHKWQVEEAEKLCLTNPKPTSKHPFKYALCAANGSGKDAFVIAPFAVWFICCKVRSLVVITSASGVQLSNQTENYIRGFSEKVNSWAREVYGQDIIKIRKRHITCLLSGSEIFLFATDEEGKAEGYHPMEPDAEMAIIVNEAKSVPPEIFRALKRCTGYNYWINISTPGEPIGDFYDSFENWPNKRRVDYFDCPHQSPTEFEEDRRVLGEHSPLFRSKWLALFTFIGGKYVINQEALAKLKRANIDGKVKALKQDWPLRVGIDIALSGNGDETVISIWRGNKQAGQRAFKSSDATVVAGNIEHYLAEYKIKKDHPHIFADDGGVGRAVISILNRRGWNIKRILNNSAAMNKKGYRNRGAELWFKFSRLIEACGLIFQPDEKLYKQVASRKYKESEAGIDKLQLESKRSMISQGLPSPDRADAAVLAFADVSVEELLNAIETQEEKPQKRKRSMEEMEELLWNREFPEQQAKKKHSRFSVRSVIKNRKNNLEGMTFYK